MMDRDWDAYWLLRARLNATMATCAARHVGAVAVRDRRSFADAFNGNVPGAVHCDDGGCERCANHSDFASGTELERCVCVHAEANLVAYCAREGIGLNASTVYCTTKPCATCMKLLLVAGVVEIVFDDDYPNQYYPSLERVTLRRFRVRSS